MSRVVKGLATLVLIVSVIAAGGLLVDDFTHWLTPETQFYPPLYWVLLDLRGLGLVVGLLYLIRKFA